MDVFAVGGIILYYDSIIWSPIISGTTSNLFAVWGSSETDVFAVGIEGTIYHYDWIIWSEMESGITTSLRDVWGSSGADVFAVGSGGTILYYDGVEEEEENTPPTAHFTVDPTSGDISTHFYSDASGCSDAEDSIDFLEVRWDWEDDGVWDTVYSTYKIGVHSYSRAGTYTIRIEVRDTKWLTDTTTQQVEVTDGICLASHLLGEEDSRLDTLRRFRDKVLAKNKIGRELIGLYYTYGERTIELLKKRPVIEKVTRKILDIIMPIVESLVDDG